MPHDTDALRPETGCPRVDWVFRIDGTIVRWDWSNGTPHLRSLGPRRVPRAKALAKNTPTLVYSHVVKGHPHRHDRRPVAQCLPRTHAPPQSPLPTRYQVAAGRSLRQEPRRIRPDLRGRDHRDSHPLAVGPRTSELTPPSADRPLHARHIGGSSEHRLGPSGRCSPRDIRDSGRRVRLAWMVAAPSRLPSEERASERWASRMACRRSLR